MIYKFKSKASGDVIMLGPTGDKVLSLLGREPSPKGIFEPRDMPAAMETLSAAVRHDEAIRAGHICADANGDDDPVMRPATVSLRQRVWPLVDMMRRCHAENEPIVWGV